MMEQLALQRPISSAYPTKIKALDKDALSSLQPSASTSQGAPQAHGPIRKNDDFFAQHLSAKSQASPTQTASAPSISDVAEPAMNIIGGAIMGGPIGALTAAAGEIFAAISGDSVMGHVASLITGSEATTTLAAKANRAYVSADGLTRTP